MSSILVALKHDFCLQVDVVQMSQMLANVWNILKVPKIIIFVGKLCLNCVINEIKNGAERTKQDIYINKMK